MEVAADRPQLRVVYMLACMGRRNNLVAYSLFSTGMLKLWFPFRNYK